MGTLLFSPLLATLLLSGAAPTPVPEVPFAELAAAPELWLGETVETIVQVRGAVREAWEGYLSGFTPGNAIALDVWADSQLLWHADEFAAPAGRLYVSPLTLLGAAFRPGDTRAWAPHTRLRARVRVEAFTAGRGWIALLDARPTVEQVPEGTVLHAIRGFELSGKNAPALALSELEKALLAPLPAHARRPLEAERERLKRLAQPPTPAPVRRRRSQR